MEVMKISFRVPCFQFFPMAKVLVMLREHLMRSGSKWFPCYLQGGK